MGNDSKPAGAEIDRAMIPKVPYNDKKSAYANAHRAPASVRAVNPLTLRGGYAAGPNAGPLPVRGKSL
jgi:hypothetical protein